MKRFTPRDYAARARLIKALAHPTRLYIIDCLAEHEYCVNDLTAMVGCDVSTMSKHLGVLRNAGAVKDERRGACIYYTLRCSCILSFFTCTDKVLRTVHDQREV
jgi:DNA-binding transcriptional ArsR family regulator